MDFPTREDLRQVARDELLASTAKVTAAAVDLPGTDAYALLTAMSAVGDELAARQARLQAVLLISSSRGQDLDRLVYDRYGLLRKAASAAVGSVSFSLPTASVSSFAIPAETLLSTSDGRQFLTTAEVLFPSSSTGPVVAAVRATTAGLSSQAAAGTINSLIGAVPGAPSGLAVTNTLATAGAAEAEEDDALKARALAFFLTARRATKEAIRQGALAVPGVQTADVFESVDALGRPARSVQLIVSDAYTASLAKLVTVPPTYQAQSQVLTTLVSAGLEDSRAAGIYVDVQVARVVIQTVVLALSFRAGVDVDQTALRARAAVVAYVNALPPGSPFVRAEAVSRLRFVYGLLVSGSEVLSPAGDVVPLPLEVLRTGLGFVAASTVQPDARLAGTANPDAA